MFITCDVCQACVGLAGFVIVGVVLYRDVKRAAHQGQAMAAFEFQTVAAFHRIASRAQDQVRARRTLAKDKESIDGWALHRSMQGSCSPVGPRKSRRKSQWTTALSTDAVEKAKAHETAEKTHEEHEEGRRLAVQHILKQQNIAAQRLQGRLAARKLSMKLNVVQPAGNEHNDNHSNNGNANAAVETDHQKETPPPTAVLVANDLGAEQNEASAMPPSSILDPAASESGAPAGEDTPKTTQAISPAGSVEVSAVAAGTFPADKEAAPSVGGGTAAVVDDTEGFGGLIDSGPDLDFSKKAKAATVAGIEAANVASAAIPSRKHERSSRQKRQQPSKAKRGSRTTKPGASSNRTTGKVRKKPRKSKAKSATAMTTATAAATKRTPSKRTRRKRNTVAGAALPKGWQMATDPNTTKVFYFNKETKETQWQKPI